MQNTNSSEDYFIFLKDTYPDCKIEKSGSLIILEKNKRKVSINTAYKPPKVTAMYHPAIILILILISVSFFIFKGFYPLIIRFGALMIFTVWFFAFYNPKVVNLRKEITEILK